MAFDALTDNGTSNVIDIQDRRTPLTWYTAGDIGGGTVKLEVSYDEGTNWTDVTDAVMTAQTGQQEIALYGPLKVRQTLSGATGPNLLGGVL